MTMQPGRADARRPLLGDRRAGRHQAEIDAFEKSNCSRSWHLSVLVAEGHLGAERPARGEREDLVHRKFALGEDVQHFPADIAGGADDCDLVTHLELILGLRQLSITVICRAVQLEESFWRNLRLSPGAAQQFLANGVAHLAGADPLHSRLHDVAGADALRSSAAAIALSSRSASAPSSKE